MSDQQIENDLPLSIFYWIPAGFYAFLMFCQYCTWLMDKKVNGVFIFSLAVSVTHVIFALFMPLKRVSAAFWLSCLLWGFGFFISFGIGLPASWFVLGGGLSLILMYEAYAMILEQEGNSTLPRYILFRWMGGKRTTARVFDSDSKSLRPGPITQSVKSRFNFASIYGMEDEKKRIKNAANDIIQAKKKGGQTRNGILLTGEPGNGKTQLAKALAGELSIPFIELTNGLVASVWVNETTVNLMRALNEARSKAPCVLLIDEIDSFLSDRSGSQRNDTEDSKIVNTLLTELVNLRNSGVIIVAATNHVEKLDSAGIREGRFDFKIEVLPPDAPAREKILQSEIKRIIGNVTIEDGAIETATRRWNGFSVVRILSVAKEIESHHRQSPYKTITAADIFSALRVLQGSQGMPVANAKGIDRMLLPASLREDLHSIVYRMQNIQEVEDAGGSLPTGLIFYGADPGTGKTECARSLAKDSGWAFLATTSNDLIANNGLIDKLYKDALNIRPCIIFIDEANDVLRDRAYSNYSALTNKLLTVMDGVASEKRDIMFIAATNYIEHVDQAVLRGGRISEKFHFGVPDRDQQIEFMRHTIARSKSVFASALNPEKVVSMMEDAGVRGTVANMSAIALDAVNTKVSRGPSASEVTVEDMRKAISRQTVSAIN